MNTFDKNSNIALNASAGTGKTFQLSLRVAIMLMEGIHPSDILCLTFTKKATNEMQERIIRVLNAAAEGSSPESERKILEEAMRKHAARHKEEYTDDYLKNAAKIARERLFADFSSLKIKNIDAFNNLILKMFPLEAGLRPDYEIRNEDEADLLEKAFYITLDDILQKKEWTPVLQKTLKIMKIHSDSNYEKTLHKYANFSATKYIELKEAMDDITPEKIRELLDDMETAEKKAIKAAHAFADEFKEKALNGKQIKVYKNIKNISNIGNITNGKIFTIYSPNEHGDFEKYAFTDKQLMLHKETKEQTKGYFIAKREAVKALSLSVGKIIYNNLKKIKDDKNILTYQDISEKVYEMLVTDKKHIDKDYLYFRLDGRITHILLDEFQDTSLIQWLILKPLAEEAMAGMGQKDKSGSFFYVGDPKQDLYRFRGSKSGLFAEVEETYKDKLKKDNLHINYRSDKHIVNIVNEIFINAADEFKSKEFEILKKEPQEPREGCAEGYVEISFFNKDFKAFTCAKVKEAKDNGWQYGDMSVLVPTNNNGAEIKSALASDGVPVRLETSSKLSDTNVFKTIIALARFIETDDDFSFIEYAFIGNHALTAKDYADETKREKIKQSIKKSAGDCELTIFERLINAIKYTELQSRFEEDPDFIQTMNIIAQTAPNEKNIVLFSEAITKSARSCQSITAEKQDAITIMTINKSKGLQFPLVILPKLDIELEVSAKSNRDPFIMKYKKMQKGSQEIPQGNIEFIHTQNANPFLVDEYKETIKEENDLIAQDALNKLYVAMTRAKHALIMGVEEKKNNDGNTIEHRLPLLVKPEHKLPFTLGELKAVQAQSKDHAQKDNKPFSAKCHKLEEKRMTSTVKGTISFMAAEVGTLFHKAAFLLNGFTDEAAEQALKEAFVYNGAFIGEKDRQEVANYLKILVKMKEWRELFNGSVFRERKVGSEDKLYSIDFYSVMQDKTVLIDYKTGEMSAEQEKEYKRQLNNYEEILNKLYKKPVHKYIYHFNKGGLNIKKY